MAREKNDRRPVLSRNFALVSFMASALFLVFLAVLHFIEPEFEPSRHMISEYELGRYGWMMSLAFFSLGAGILSLVLSVWFQAKTVGGIVGKWWLLFLFIVLIGAGIFYPYETPNLASKIHTLCGMIVIFTFPVAIIPYSFSLSRDPAWKDKKKRLLWSAVLVWTGLIVFIVSLVIFRPDRSNGKVSIVVGWENRFLMLTYALWLILLSWTAAFRKNHLK